MVRVLVTGGRDNYNWLPLWEALDRIRPDMLIEGGASGYDEGAFRWAEYHATRIRTVRAPWEAMGTSAGMARNIYMLNQFQPDLVIAGKGGVGTTGCVQAAMARHIKVLDLHWGLVT